MGASCTWVAGSVALAVAASAGAGEERVYGLQGSQAAAQAGARRYAEAASSTARIA